MLRLRLSFFLFFKLSACSAGANIRLSNASASSLPYIPPLPSLAPLSLGCLNHQSNENTFWKLQVDAGEENRHSCKQSRKKRRLRASDKYGLTRNRMQVLDSLNLTYPVNADTRSAPAKKFDSPSVLYCSEDVTDTCDDRFLLACV